MMRAKSKRQPLRLDLQADFAAHVEGTCAAHDWAAKCVAFREAGKPLQAKNAEEKARRWLKKAMVSEAHVPGTPHSGGRG
jgi:hypothetical protein